MIEGGEISILRFGTIWLGSVAAQEESRKKLFMYWISADTNKAS